MNSIDKVYYINLDYRIDRNGQLLEWLDDSGLPEDKLQRISAVHTPGRGHLGCLLSHIKTLETFLNTSYTTCIVLEDDFTPLNITTFWKDIDRVFASHVDFDLIMLATNVLKSEPLEIDFLRRVNSSFTSSGYMLTRKFAPILLENFKEAVRRLEEEEARTRQKTSQYCLDVYWQKLMPVSKWYCFYPSIGKQRESFSDIERVYTNYSG